MSDNKIVAGHLMGGLGNQIFQIFAALSYGYEFNRRVIFRYIKRSPGTEIRYTFWDTLFSDLKHLTTIDSDINDADIKNYPYYREGGHHWKPFNDSQNDKLLLFGFFQSPKYFDKYYEKIIQLFKLEHQKSQIKQQYIHFFNATSGDICSMHFRIGDYRRKQDCHPVMPYQYYESAMNKIISKNNKIDRIIYFYEKDDYHDVMDIINKLIDKYTTIEFFPIDHSIPDWKQLLLMSCCHHNIIGNSSFSWWGAYFNSNKAKNIIYPSEWFGWKLKRNNVRDLFPDDWIEINVTLKNLKNTQNHNNSPPPTRLPKTHNINISFTEPHLSNNDKNMFYKYLDQISSYFEYGSGGSTYQASIRNNISTIFSVDSDLKWQNDLKKQISNDNITYFFNEMDVQPKSWGHPGKNATNPQKINYSNQFNNIDSLQQQAIDMILINGRFRVACCLKFFHLIRDDTFILFNDFLNRPKYNVILQYFDIIEQTSDNKMVVLKKKQNVTVPTNIINKYELDQS